MRNRTTQQINTRPSDYGTSTATVEELHPDVEILLKRSPINVVLHIKKEFFTVFDGSDLHVLGCGTWTGKEYTINSGLVGKKFRKDLLAILKEHYGNKKEVHDFKTC